MIELKPGNGGYGLEAYDTTTGKYASNVSVSLEDEDTGQKYNFSNFKDFLKQIYGNQFLQTYEEDEEFRKMIHDYKGENGIWQTWETLLRQEVDRLNAEEEARNTNVEFYATAMEVANNAHKFFTKELIDEMFEKDVFLFGLSYKKDGTGSSCNGIAELFRIARYGKTKMKPITRQEFDEKCGIFAENEIYGDYDELYERIQEVKASENKCIPIYRGMRIHNITDDKIALASHYKTDFHSKESIYFTGSGYYGSVIYMSASKSYVSDYGYAYNKNYLNAYVELNDDYKIAFCPNSYTGNKQMENFKKYESKIFIRNLENSMKNMGYSQSQISEVSGNVYAQIEDNVGFIAMLFGYDGICGEDGQFDQLNMSKVKCVDEGWF